MSGTSEQPLILASASPRRRELLGRLGLPFTIVPSDVDEMLDPTVAPPVAAMLLAVSKARAVASGRPDATVIGADTIVVLPEAPPRILGKPADAAEATMMLCALRDRWHSVSTGIAVVRGDAVWRDVVTADVRMAAYGDDAIARYIASGEPFDKAGGYAAQGLGGALVAEIRGSELTVVGLPLRRLAELLREAGVAAPIAPAAIVDRWAL